jgi:hypothetical protein
MENEQAAVYLDGNRIPISGSVIWDKVTPFPDAFIDQPPTEADFKPVKKQRWGSLRGGAGVEKWSLKDNDRYWEATDIDTSQSKQTLGPLVTTLASFGAAPVKLIWHNDALWAIGHRAISSWNGSAWSSKKTDIDNPTDAILYYGTVS